MSSSILGTEVANSVRMDEIGREKGEKGRELRVWRERRVQHIRRFIAEYEHSNRLLSNTPPRFPLHPLGFEVLRCSRFSRRQRLRRFFSPRRNYAGTQLKFSLSLFLSHCPTYSRLMKIFLFKLQEQFDVC